MDMNPPEGSAVSIRDNDGHPTVTIPAKAIASRYLGGAFLLLWLVGWAFGFRSAALQVMSGKGGLFLIVWLGGWTLGGMMAALAVYRIFRSTVPETLQLKRGSVVYDSGIPPFEFNAYQKRKSARDYWNSLLSRRVCAELNRGELQTLRLRETETGNRLTVDIGAQRIDLASQAGEVEREWIARLLVNRYGLNQALSGAAIEKT